ncbi:hypothetical protein JW933_02925 [candidate division FCPU426 bacterium]|nr:hypothetical protein [candidate division FCPU426 bacterium]
MKEFSGNELAKQVLERIKPFTCFPEILLDTQSKKKNLNLVQMKKSDLPALADAIEKAISTFGSPEKGLAAKMRIMELANGA